ncbi:MAG: 50S ribosomal protein L18 [Candidatus Micrarchaeia archaeon]
MSEATGPTYDVPFRRRRKNLTNYRKRLALLKAGVRLVFRKSLNHTLVQLVEFSEKGDLVLACAHSSELRAFGWPPRANTPTAYLTGFLAAKRALAKGIKHAVLDAGLATPRKGGTAYAALKGALDAGLTVPAGDGIFDEARFAGRHIAEYARKLKGTPLYAKQFSAYIREGVEPERLPELFEQVKNKISSG